MHLHVASPIERRYYDNRKGVSVKTETYTETNIPLFLSRYNLGMLHLEIVALKRLLHNT